MDSVFKRSLGEEIANAILHGLGAIAGLFGLVFLAMRANGVFGGPNASGRETAALVIFAATMTVMFLASTLYHALTNEKAKRVFKALDHGAIYLFIAGTYTPFCLLALPPTTGLVIFILEWAAAIGGISLYAFRCTFQKKLEIVVYLIMGWAVVAGAPYLVSNRSLPLVTLILLASGGLCYTAGIFWYAQKRTAGAHIVWHVFVLLGAACHYWAVWFIA
jgi:hemolysin III